MVQSDNATEPYSTSAVTVSPGPLPSGQRTAGGRRRTSGMVNIRQALMGVMHTQSAMAPGLAPLGKASESGSASSDGSGSAASATAGAGPTGDRRRGDRERLHAEHDARISAPLGLPTWLSGSGSGGPGLGLVSGFEFG